MEALPLELVSHICTFLGRSGLFNFALTSRSFLAPARYQLYTTLTLRSDSSSTKNTFTLLLDHPHLARRIQALTIETDPEWGSPLIASAGTSTWLDLQIFRKMERLRKLRFERPPCAKRGEEYTEFYDILTLVYKQCGNLKELTVVGFSWPVLPEEWVLPPAPLELTSATRPKLQKVACYSPKSPGLDWSFLIYYMLTPSNTITHLDLFFGNGAHHFSALGTVSFPALRTLYIRDLPRAGVMFLATFLGCHPSINHLFLIDVDPLIPGDKIQMTMLPNLKTLRGSPNLLARLGIRCESVRHVQVLILDFDNPHGDCVEDTAMLIEAVQGFPNLLHCSISRVITAENTADIISIFAIESTLLSYWSGGFYYRDSEPLLTVAEALTAFPALKRIDICDWTFPEIPPSSDQLRNIAQIVKMNPTIECFTLFMPHLPTNEISHVYFVRLPENHVVELALMYECIEGGPHIRERRYVDLAASSWNDQWVLEE